MDVHLAVELFERQTLPSYLSIGITNKEIQEFSVRKLIRAAATKDFTDAGLERAVSLAYQNAYSKFGIAGGGYAIPPEVRLHHYANTQRRAFDVGTAGNAGNLVQSEVRLSELGDALRPNAVLARLGATILTAPNGNLVVPRLTVTTPTGVLGETAQLIPGQPTTADVAMTAHRASAQVITTKAAAITTNESVGRLLEADIVASLGSQIDYIGLNGTGGGQPVGLLNNAGIDTSVVGGANGAQIAWSHIVDLEAAVAISNAEPNQFSGYVCNTKSRQWMKKNPRSTYLDNIWGESDPAFPLNGYRSGVTTNVPANLTKGTSNNCSALIFGADWSQFLIALFGPLDVVVDSITKADTGEVAITVNQYFDVGLRQPKGFSVMKDALTA